MAQRVPPLIAASVVVLVVTIVGFWGYVATSPGAIAHISRMQARLNDASCVFSADVMLRSRADEWEFQRKQVEVRAALVDLLRTKSRYMVSSAVAREALRRQMVREVNRVMDEPAASELQFTEFVLS
ncbi:MAG: flagellar basal body-associated FliL family protein [Candidatus Binatia bacterium]